MIFIRQVHLYPNYSGSPLQAGNRNGDEWNEGGAPVLKENIHDQGHQDDGFHERVLDFINGIDVYKRQDVPNPDKLLIPYLTANVQFVVEDIRNAFLVSNAARRFRPETELVLSLIHI